MDIGRVLLLNLAAYAALALAAAAGIICLRKAGRWLPLPRLRRGHWSGGEVLACILLAQFMPEALVAVLDEANFFFQIFDKHVPYPRQMFVLSPLTLTLQFAVFFWLLHRVHQTYPMHVGLTPARWRANVRLGLAAFCVTTPVVLGLYFLAVLVTQQTPHPFEEMARQGLFVFEWFFLGFQVIVAAPLLEEWLFRGLLQGWLRRASPVGHLALVVCALVVGAGPFLKSYYAALVHQAEQRAWEEALQLPDSDPEMLAELGLLPAAPVLWGSLVFAIVVVGLYSAGVLRLWWPVFQSGLRHFVEQPVAGNAGPGAALLEGETPVLIPSGPRWEQFKIANARWAIFGSAMFFALSHAAWPSAVPLVPLGLVLGWLAYRTQSLVPGIVLHALFNAVALVVLLASTL